MKCNICGRETVYPDRCYDCQIMALWLPHILTQEGGREFVRKTLLTVDDWCDRWDYEAVLRENEVTVEKAEDYWYTLGWRHGSMGINADNDIIARKSVAVFVELWMRGFSCSFADHLAHGFAMWLELQDQRYSFELTKELGDAVLKMNSCRMSACLSDEEENAWDKLVESARLCNKRGR